MTKRKPKNRELILAELSNLKKFHSDFRKYSEECPKCKQTNTYAYCIKDVAFSIHYIHDVADFICSDCGHKWSGQYGYKGLA